MNSVNPGLAKPFDPLTAWGEDIARIQEQDDARQSELQAQKEAARIKAAQRVASGEHDPVEAYKAAYDIPLMLSLCGYTRNGKGWLSPNSESGNPGVTISNDGQKWFSHHDSDSDIGTKGNSGTWGDAFDLFVHYSHGGDYNAALKAAGQMFLTDSGVSLNKANQIEHVINKSREETMDTFDNIAEESSRLNLSGFVLNGESKAMKKQMLEDKFILGRIALYGQSTIIYAGSNVGKTLIVIFELINAIKSKTIKGEDVFFINADDNHKGLTFKLMLAEQYKFNMLAPGYRGFKAEMLTGAIQTMIKDEDARGKILILDTVKKFTDLMDKKRSSAFAECVRQFVSHGGSVVMLAHINKHRGDDGKVVYSGTTDLKDDCDCAYSIDIVHEDKINGPRTIKFENLKNRGDVANEVVYSYDCSNSLTYRERLDSVYEVKNSEYEEAEKMAALEKRYLKNKEAIDTIKNVLRKGEMNKTDLIKTATAETALSKRKIITALDDHTGLNESNFQFWTVETREKNAKVYALNSPF